MSSINLVTKLINCVVVSKVIAARPSLVSLAVTDTLTESDLGKKRLILPYLKVPSAREAEAKTKNRNLEAGTEGKS